MTTINLSRVRPSANVHMDPMSLSSRASACKGVSRRMLCQQVVSRSWRLLGDLVCSRGTLKFRSCHAGSRAKRCQTRNQVHDFCRAASSSANSIQGWPEKVYQGKCRGSMFCNVPEEQLNSPTFFWQAQLVSHAQQMGMDESGTKNDLVERLLVTLSTEAVAQPVVPANDTQVSPLACNIYTTSIWDDLFSRTLQRMIKFHPDCSLYRRRFTSCRLN